MIAFKSNIFVGSSSRRRSGLKNNDMHKKTQIKMSSFEKFYFENKARANARRMRQPPEKCLQGKK